MQIHTCRRFKFNPDLYKDIHLARLLLNQLLIFCIKNYNQPNHQNISGDLPGHNIKHRE